MKLIDTWYFTFKIANFVRIKPYKHIHPKPNQIKVSTKHLLSLVFLGKEGKRMWFSKLQGDPYKIIISN